MSDKKIMLPDERLDYSPIAGRRPLYLPDGARMAVWVIVNVEEWDPREPMPCTVLTPPAGCAPMPDIPNWAWHEYGNRVGFWRLLEVLDEAQVRAVLAINGSAIERYEPIVQAASRSSVFSHPKIRRICRIFISIRILARPRPPSCGLRPRAAGLSATARRGRSGAGCRAASAPAFRATAHSCCGRRRSFRSADGPERRGPRD